LSGAAGCTTTGVDTIVSAGIATTALAGEEPLSVTGLAAGLAGEKYQKEP
jgi:hypothetical protein